MSNNKQFKAGDKVRINPFTEKDYAGYTKHLVEYFNSEHEIIDIDLDDDDALLGITGWWFPLSALTLVSDQVADGEKPTNEELIKRIQELKEECRRIKIQRNEIEQKYIKKCRLSVNQHIEIEALKIQLKEASSNLPSNTTSDEEIEETLCEISKALQDSMFKGVISKDTFNRLDEFISNFVTPLPAQLPLQRLKEISSNVQNKLSELDIPDHYAKQIVEELDTFISQQENK